MVPVPEIGGVPAPPARPAAEAWPPWADFVTIAAAFMALALWTWGGWPDVLMDFGRELYVAWRVSAGDVLYRDVASFYGPLSPYLNAAWFRLFGVSLRTLALANLAVLAAITAVLWLIVRRGTERGRWAATAGALTFLAVCGFAQRVSSGSFNFVAPYSHEATHGFALAAGAVLAALRLIETGRVRWASLAGALAGVAFLTKPESFVAALGASGTGVALALWRPGRGRTAARTLAAYAGAMLAAPAVALALLATSLPAAQAFAGLLGSWAYVGNEELRANPYFAWSLGTSDLGGSLAALGRAAAVQALFVTAAAALAWVAGRRRRLAVPLAVASAAAVLVVLLPAGDAGAWLHVARPLPLWALAAAAASAVLLRRSRDEHEFARHAARLVLALFALLFALRMILHARLYHYGFVLAGPGLLVVVAALVDWIPAALERRGGSAAVFRSASLALVAVAVWSHLGSTQGWMRAKRAVVGEGADRSYVNAAMRGVTGLAQPGDTLVVLPEGVMINYLLRMRSSIPFMTALPAEVAVFGEDAFLRALQRDPPSLILLVHRDTSEFGARSFGSDYALSVARWIDARYARVGGAGEPPFRPGTKFGVVALRLRTPPTPGAQDAARP
jgi:hypothetical protein